MHYDLISGGKLPIKAWVQGVEIDFAARQQLINLSNMPFMYSHIAAMPDVHWGKGATVGSVIATKGAIIPAAVGVDIGCGMAAQRTTFKASDLPDNLYSLRCKIESQIPHGRSNNGGPRDRGAWHTVQKENELIIKPYIHLLEVITSKHPKLERAATRAPLHAGTLGTGNHFIEICLDEEQRVWVMLHSGSRGIGNAIGSYFIEKAKKEMTKRYINLPDQDLAYISQGSKLFEDYFEALNWAQDYARMNRDLMMKTVLSALASYIHKSFECDLEAINCHHNYVEWEHHFDENLLVTRKGAVNAHENVLGIIPGSMGAKSFIVRGKGNRDAFCSCSHGAGRSTSRREAKKKFTIDEHIVATSGVECRKDEGILDETPAAYKNIDAVMSAQSDLVDVIHTLKQVVCVKG